MVASTSIEERLPAKPIEGREPQVHGGVRSGPARIFGARVESHSGIGRTRVFDRAAAVFWFLGGAAARGQRGADEGNEDEGAGSIESFSFLLYIGPGRAHGVVGKKRKAAAITAIVAAHDAAQAAGNGKPAPQPAPVTGSNGTNGAAGGGAGATATNGVSHS